MTSIPYSFAQTHSLAVDGGTCLMTEATPVSAFAEAQRLSEGYLQVRRVSATVLSGAHEELYADSASAAAGAAELASGQGADLAALADSAASVDDLLEQREDAPVVRLINALLLEAIQSDASDVHVEVEEKALVVRFRIDGTLREALRTTRTLAPQLVSRIKVMGRLDIAEKRLPQDGRVSLRVGEYHLDARISTIPAQHGERVVMRLLDRDQTRSGEPFALHKVAIGMREAALWRLTQRGVIVEDLWQAWLAFAQELAFVRQSQAFDPRHEVLGRQRFEDLEDEAGVFLVLDQRPKIADRA